MLAVLTKNLEVAVDLLHLSSVGMLAILAGCTSLPPAEQGPAQAAPVVLPPPAPAR